METVHYEYGVTDYTLPRRPGGKPGIARRRMRVEVVAAGATRTKIRFLEYHADGRGPGTVANVKSGNVRYESVRHRPITPYRLPYADDWHKNVPTEGSRRRRSK